MEIPWTEMEAIKPGCTHGIDRDNADKRAGTLAAAVANGATVAELARIAAAPKATRKDRLAIATRFGHLSRGKAWGRQGRGGNVTWAEKDGGTVYLTEGKWTVGSDDGFRRKDQAEWTVTCIAGVLIGE